MGQVRRTWAPSKAADVGENSIEMEDPVTEDSDSQQSSSEGRGDCAVASDCLTTIGNTCLAYYKWLLFLLYNAYWIYGICQTWHKVRSQHRRLSFDHCTDLLLSTPSP